VTGLALGLVLLSALAHASWNLLAKRTAGGPAFTWTFDLVSAACCLPLLAAQLWLAPVPVPVDAVVLLFVIGSGLMHLGYFLLLGQGYRLGDLSLVYPLARGLGPLLATCVAIAWLGERPSPLALGGTVLIGVGVFVLAGDPRLLHEPKAGASVLIAALTGVMIAAYTLWDKQAVSTVGLPPVFYLSLLTLTRVTLLAPYGLARLPAVRLEWQTHRAAAVGIGVLSLLSYLLALQALAISPVSYVAPAREIGILFGAWMGARWLGETQGRRRLLGAGAMVAGVVALAIG
jgi:drug/metabolite transporter (DMT)-like permease